MDNIRIVPIQQLCMLCSEELPERDTAQGLANQLCLACIRLIGEEMVFRELELRPVSIYNGNNSL